MSVNSGPKLPTENLILSLDVFRTRDWNLNTETWTDASNASNDAIISGLGNGLSLDNTDGYFTFPLNNSFAEMTIPGGISLGTDDFTIEAWVYPTSFSNTINIFSIVSDVSSSGSLQINTSGLILFSADSFSSTSTINSWNASLNNWNHIILVRKNNVAFGYLNGNLIGSAINFSDNFTQNTVTIRPAASNSGAMRLRTIRCWDKALTDEEIKKIFTYFVVRNYISVPETGLTAIQEVATFSTQISQLFEVTPVKGIGGGGGYGYSISPSLPIGLALDETTGKISGIPNSLFTQSYTITVTDRILSTASTTFNLEILPAPLEVIPNNDIFTFGTNTNVNFSPVSVVGGFGTLTYSISPALPTSTSPPSLTLDSSTGIISGVPTGYVIDQNYTVTVTDEASQTAQATFNLIIEPQPIGTSVLSPLVSLNTGDSVSVIPITATGGETPITYSINPTLPSPLVFNTSTGEITGSPSAAFTQSQFTVTVTDGVGQTAQNTFFLEITAALYEFTQHVFTNANATGQNGPSLNACLSAYEASTWTANNQFFNVPSLGIQEWTVPETATYRIIAGGASGGTHVRSQTLGTGNFNSFGAQVQGDFNFTLGDKIRIVVGQRGEDSGTYFPGLANNQGEGDNAAPGGGGGTFVYINASDSTPLIAAGGGAGGTKNLFTGVNASLTTAGQNSQSTTAVNGGINGNGGTPLTGGGSYWSAGGAGWLTNGTGGNQPTAYNTTPGSLGAEGGRRVANGAQGGTRWNDGTDSGGNGGFGGGGGGGSDNMGTGGGGGYSGGGGSNSTPQNAGGGGGGSFITNTASNTSITLRTEVGHGFVSITKL